MELERWEILKASYWEGPCEEIDLKIEMAFNELVNCTPDEVLKLQERIKTLREVKSIPEDVIERQSSSKEK